MSAVVLAYVDVFVTCGLVYRSPDELKFERHSEMAVVYHETIDEVITVCDEVIPALLEAYDELFKPSVQLHHLWCYNFAC